MRTSPRRLVPLATLALLVGCADTPRPVDSAATPVASTTPAAPPPVPTPSVTRSPARYDKALHDELVAMLRRDQADREGRPQAESDQARTARLKEIVAAHGWPTIDLVGEDGEDAAWAIAQHSDFDLAFQERAVELLRAAVAAGQASPGNLAYLEDRVAVAKGEPQVYGTQVRCGPDGPVPATPIRDEAGVDGRRAGAGLPSFAAYLAEMAAICAEGG
ncbi:DUF6624 domain-containing protein [Micromonospora globbae]|jgi:hypothetical protein|uniref:Lipoprotein n=1 Tax=Micromonospora globbae TaxID=1894969 RepID=A0A420F035_9ACTN|nr:DUF6624 domain-containing protein [Micromonospora globbae]RKF26366.1 hypothetical protein D7I43_15200 [Micromonospora globbae]WTF83453.1 hypothetical protein OH732_16945 [Micromonospora globbae]